VNYFDGDMHWFPKNGDKLFGGDGTLRELLREGETSPNGARSLTDREKKLVRDETDRQIYIAGQRYPSVDLATVHFDPYYLPDIRDIFLNETAKHGLPVSLTWHTDNPTPVTPHTNISLDGINVMENLTVNEIVRSAETVIRKGEVAELPIHPFEKQQQREIFEQHELKKLLEEKGFVIVTAADLINIPAATPKKKRGEVYVVQ
jgi:hypothetical protein